MKIIDQERRRDDEKEAGLEDGFWSQNRTDDTEDWDEGAKLMQHSSAYDDVNNLSLTFDRSHSYLGFSSVGIILRRIVESSPRIHSRLAQDIQSHASHLPVTPSDQEITSNGEEISPTTEICIDAYFAHVNGITPMLDEIQFRRRVKENNANDVSWQALLNMVLVMGAVALGQWKSNFLRNCFHQARRFMNMELLGSVQIESLQALCLLGGYYLHFRSTPNMANAVLGAAFRMAAAMGLHKEAIVSHATKQRSNQREPDIKRRTWWSLFCLDTWASMTLGRPTFGRWNKATMDTDLPCSIESDPAVSILRASAEFCLLATEIQERFARDAPVSTEEVLDYDLRVTNWYNALPACVIESHGDLANVAVAQAYLRNRYLNLRVLLHRPFLLQLSWPDITRSDAQAAAVAKCREMSFEAIANIAQSVMPNTIWAWNSTWYLYQACMVPLFIMATDPHGEGTGICKSKLRDALATFEALIPRTPAAKRSHSIVKSIYEATQDLESRSDLMENPNFDLLDMDVNGFWDLNNVGLDFDFLLNYNDLEGYGLEN